MKTKAVRIYGKNDLRLEEFELPAMKDDEILARVVSDSICMSSHKAAEQGADHKRVPKDIATNPTIIGHEFCGVIESVGKKWAKEFKAGDKFSIQPALNYKGSLDAPGYSFRWIGGNATYVLIPSEVMEMGCLLKYDGEAFFYGSLAEPVSCIVGAFHAQYHTTGGSYAHRMGIVAGGSLAILAGAGPMGLGAVDYAIHNPVKPKLLIVTDIDDARLNRAAEILPPAEAQKCGVELKYINTSKPEYNNEYLINLTAGLGYDDVFVFAPVKPVVEQGDKLLARDGCLNFFAGPIDPAFSAAFNFYNVHYASTHIVGTSGGNTDDMKECLKMTADGKINPAAMITHVGGLNAAIDTTLNLPKIPGGKKLLYTHKNLPLTAIADFEREGAANPFFKRLSEICKRHNNLWNLEAEQYLLVHAQNI
ncbi:L-sorbose 1-phosphate reductase [Clostridia bacterium]|nr:L-sorbose 1-phosphate reductase [Clostridia bacterium]